MTPRMGEMSRLGGTQRFLAKGRRISFYLGFGGMDAATSREISDAAQSLGQRACCCRRRAKPSRESCPWHRAFDYVLCELLRARAA